MARKLSLLNVAVLSSVLVCALDTMKPLSKTEEFMLGELHLPNKAAEEEAVPERLNGLARDRSPLPDGIWLRFQNFGAQAFKNYSAQMQIDHKGNLYVAAYLGNATTELRIRPEWPRNPSQKITPSVLRDIRQKATALLRLTPTYRGDPGMAHVPIFVITVKIDDREREFIFEGYENEFVKHLRRISYFAYSTRLKSANQEKR